MPEYQEFKRTPRYELIPNRIEIHKKLQRAVPPMYQGVGKVSCREFQITWRVRQEESRIASV